MHIYILKYMHEHISASVHLDTQHLLTYNHVHTHAHTHTHAHAHTRRNF